MVCNFFCCISLFSFSMGIRKYFLKKFRSPNNPGLIKFICDHKSKVLFSMGVPVKMSLLILLNFDSSFVMDALGFLIF